MLAVRNTKLLASHPNPVRKDDNAFVIADIALLNRVEIILNVRYSSSKKGDCDIVCLFIVFVQTSKVKPKRYFKHFYSLFKQQQQQQIDEVLTARLFDMNSD